MIEPGLDKMLIMPIF